MVVIDRFLDAGKETNTPLQPIEGYEKKPLVSLEEAVEPVKKMVSDLDRNVWLAKRKTFGLTCGLTVDEATAIYIYTMEWAEKEKSVYAQLNSTLRSFERGTLKPWFSYLKLILTALWKLPPIKCVIWRGIHGDVRDQYKEDCIWWGFSSCTESMPIMETFLGKSGSRTVFMIECINGKSIQKYSFFNHENEILLVPGTYLRVVDKCSLGEGLHMIRLKETTPSHTLLQPPFGSLPSITSGTPQNETQPKSKHDEAIFAKLQVVKKVDVRGCGSAETTKLFYK